MKVLLGVGGSEDSFRALHQTLARTEVTGDDLTIGILENPESTATPSELDEEIRSVVDEYDVKVTIRLVEGDPGPRLIEIAGDEAFDRIVLGGGKRSPMGKISVGSIAEFVILNAQTSVTLIR